MRQVVHTHVVVQDAQVGSQRGQASLVRDLRAGAHDAVASAKTRAGPLWGEEASVRGVREEVLREVQLGGSRAGTCGHARDPRPARRASCAVPVQRVSAEVRATVHVGATHGDSTRAATGATSTTTEEHHEQAAQGAGQAGSVHLVFSRYYLSMP